MRSSRAHGRFAFGLLELLAPASCNRLDARCELLLSLCRRISARLLLLRYMRCQAFFEEVHLTVLSCALYSDSWFIARLDFTAALVWRCMPIMLAIFAAK